MMMDARVVFRSRRIGLHGVATQRMTVPHIRMPHNLILDTWIAISDINTHKITLFQTV